MREKREKEKQREKEKKREIERDTDRKKEKWRNIVLFMHLSYTIPMFYHVIVDLCFLENLLF